MQILTQINDFHENNNNQILTIGNFDGLHLGHQAILKKIDDLALDTGLRIVLTFSNHPSTILTPDNPLHLLTTLKHKLNLFKQYPIDYLLLIPFAKKLSEKTPEGFISYIRQYIPFKHLILGHNATIGKNKTGGKQALLSLAKKYNFEVHYLQSITVNNIVVSSTRIRTFIKEGSLKEASQLLGRKYSFFSHISKGAQKGRSLGYPTANMEVNDLCLPPLGVYAIRLRHNNQTYHGVANLGLAPTMGNRKRPVLEAHILDYEDNLYDCDVEVIPELFLRPELPFLSLEALKKQIYEDVIHTKTLFRFLNI